MKDFSRLSPLGSRVHRKSGSVKEIVQDDTLLLHTINRKYHTAYRFVLFPITLNGLLQDLSNAIRRTIMRHCARFQLTRRVARSLGDSWVSCKVFIPRSNTLTAMLYVRSIDHDRTTNCRRSRWTSEHAAKIVDQYLFIICSRISRAGWPTSHCRCASLNV